MALPISQDGAEAIANDLLSRLKSAYSATVSAQNECTIDVYNTIVNIPSHNKSLQDLISSVQASGQVSRIVTQISEKLPSDVVIGDVQSFATLLGDLASDIEANSNLFVLSINATTKRTEFVTPIGSGVKAAIMARIAAVLAEVI